MELLVQNGTHQFGKALASELSDKKWTQVDIAVAWVRRSGLLQLQDSLLAALKRSANISIVVGIDKENTSIEGLRGLIDLSTSTKTKALHAYVRHNEAGPIFHPKFYCFRNTNEIKAFVGSNNLTQAGLFQNEELALGITDKVGSEIEKKISTYMKELIDMKSGFVLPLNDDLLKKLIALEYVRSEAVLRTTMRALSRSARNKTALFAAKHVAVPKPKNSTSDPVKPPPPGTILSPNADWPAISLRLRLARGTQAQIPLAVAREIRRRMGLTPTDGPIEMTSRLDGRQARH